MAMNKPSQAAREAAEKIVTKFLRKDDTWLRFNQSIPILSQEAEVIIQSAIDRECEPLVEALKDTKIYIAVEYGEENWRMDRINAALATIKP